jgi:hypothetical protein
MTLTLGSHGAITALDPVTNTNLPAWHTSWIPRPAPGMTLEHGYDITRITLCRSGRAAEQIPFRFTGLTVTQQNFPTQP